MTVEGKTGVPKGTLILGEGQYYSKDCYDTQLNNNVIVVGTSGAGKTRGIVKPNLLQAEGSYVISDPKGNLARDYGPYLESKGYDVLTMDFIHPEKSMKYNPITRCKSTFDIYKLAHALVYEMGYGDRSGQSTRVDPFWDHASQLLIMACIGYICESEEIEVEEKTLTLLMRFLRQSSRSLQDAYPSQNSHGNKKIRSVMDQLMDAHKSAMMAEGRKSWAVERYEDFNSSPDKTHATIVITSLAPLTAFDTLEMQQMLSGNDLDFTRLGRKKTALFVQVSDTDRSMDVVVNLFYSQLMNELCSFADEQCRDSRLPVPVQFILDDFATNARINNFQNIISNIRSRGISAMIMLQSENQLFAAYGNDAQTIIDNCNTYVYMGGSNPRQAEIIAKKANRTMTTILNMPVSMSWIFRRGKEPVLCHNFDLAAFEKEKGFVAGEGVKIKKGNKTKEKEEKGV